MSTRRSVNVLRWRQYIDYLCGQGGYNHRSFSIALGLSHSCASFWFNTIIKAVDSETYNIVLEFARVNDLKSYPQYCNMLALKEVKEKQENRNEEEHLFDIVTQLEKEENFEETSILQKNQIVVTVAEKCIDCRFCEVEKQEHFGCRLHGVSLYSNADGDILKAKECQ